MRIFVSYRRKDRDLVELLIADLKAMGHDVWYDHELVGARRWWDTILKQIEECDLFIYALTPGARDSVACRREHEYALNLNKRIAVVKLLEVNALPSEIADVEIDDYFQGDKNEVLRLVRTLNNLEEAPPRLLGRIEKPTRPPAPIPELYDAIVTTHPLSPDEQQSILKSIKDLFEKEQEAHTRGILEVLDLLEQRRGILTVNADQEIKRLRSRILPFHLIQERINRLSLTGESPSAILEGIKDYWNNNHNEQDISVLLDSLVEKSSDGLTSATARKIQQLRDAIARPPRLPLRLEIWVAIIIGVAVVTVLFGMEGMILSLFRLTPTPQPSTSTYTAVAVLASNTTLPTRATATPLILPTHTPSQTSLPTATYTPTSTATSLPSRTPTSTPTESTTIVPTTAVASPISTITAMPTATATETPLASAIVPTVASVEIASLPVKIVNTSGLIIGDGTAHVFAPSNVQPPKTVRIELELRLNNRYITPTPLGPQTSIPVTQVTSTLPPDRSTATPRIPIFTETGIKISQRMGASLICLPASFDGCDERPNLAEVRLIPLAGTTWSWIISPKPVTYGLQDLRLELWTVTRVNEGPEQASSPMWVYPFQIDVQSTGILDTLSRNASEIIVGIMGAVAVIIAALISVGRLRSKASENGSSSHSWGTKPTGFISYRRIESWPLAQDIQKALNARGADIFIDVHDINQGRFEETIKKAINERDYFILLISPNTFDSQWVIKETLYALECNKRIIPVLNGFDIEKDTLPENLTVLRDYNCVELVSVYFNAGIERIAEFMGLSQK